MSAIGNCTRSVAAGFGRHGMPRPPLMTHFVSRIKKKQIWDVQTMWAHDLDLWPWTSPRLSVIRVLVLCQCIKCKFCWYYIIRLFVFVLWYSNYSLCTRRTGRRTDGRTKATLIAPFPTGTGGIIILLRCCAYWAV